MRTRAGETAPPDVSRLGGSVRCKSLAVKNGLRLIPIPVSSIAPADDLGVLVLLMELGDVFDGAPAGDVPPFALVKHTIQQSSGAQQAQMASMQRRDGTADRDVLAWEQDLRGLLPCAGMR